MDRRGKSSGYWSLKAFVYSAFISLALTLVIWLMIEERLPLDSIVIRSIATGIFMLVPYILTEAVFLLFHTDISYIQYYIISYFSYIILLYWLWHRYFSLKDKLSRKKLMSRFLIIYSIAAALCAMIFISYYYFW